MIHMHMTNIMLMLKTMINHFFVQSLSQQNPRWRMPLRRFPTARSELELGIYRDTWCQHVEHWCFCRCSGLLQLQLTCFCMFCFGRVLPTSPCCMFFANVWGCSWGYCDNSHGDLHHKALAICYDPSPVMVAISPRIFMENCTAKFRLAPVYSKSMEMGHQNVIKCVGSTSFWWGSPKPLVTGLIMVNNG